MDVEKVAAGLTKAQRAMVVESEPGGFGQVDRSTGVPLHASLFRVAAALERKGLGQYTFGSCFEDLYFNNRDGLFVRAHLTKQGPSG